MDYLDINISIHNNTHLFENLIWKLEWQKKLIIGTNFKSENKNIYLWCKNIYFKSENKNIV